MITRVWPGIIVPLSLEAHEMIFMIYLLSRRGENTESSGQFSTARLDMILIIKFFIHLPGI